MFFYVIIWNFDIWSRDGYLVVRCFILDNVPIETLINVSSILLQFVFNDYFYFKLCGKCHNKLKNYLVGQRHVQKNELK